MGPRDTLAVARRRVLSSGVNSSEPSLGEIKRDLPFNSRNKNFHAEHFGPAKFQNEPRLGRCNYRNCKVTPMIQSSTTMRARRTTAVFTLSRVSDSNQYHYNRKLDCILFVYSIDFPSWSFQPIKLSSNNNNRYNRLSKCRNNLLQLKHQPQMPPPLRMLKSLPGMITKRSENRCVCSLRGRASIVSTSLFYLE